MWKRRFSSSATSPGFRAAQAFSTSGPTQSGRNFTGLPSSSASFFETGSSEYFAFFCPSGRPRWLISTRLAPLSSTYRIEGSDARSRLSFSTLPSLTGTLKSTRMTTRLPGSPRSSMKSLVMADLLGAVPLRHVAEQIDAAVRVAPLVVVPGDDLEEALLALQVVLERRERVVDRRA